MSARARAFGATPAREALDSASIAIGASGSATPRLDAELLVAHVLGVTRERLLTDRGLVVEGPAVRALQNAIRRRAFEREPLAYILGRRAFRHIELAVDSRALVPRPESELLVEAALERLPRSSSVLDVGTGSGAVALALKHERGDLRVIGSDVSAAALELASENAARLALDVQWLLADLLDGVPGELDAVLANLPYVAESERAALQPEIARHEPPLALFAGADGLDAIRALIAQLADRRDVGFVALEVGAGQADTVAALTETAGFARVRCQPDLAGIQRVVIGEGRTR